MGKKDKKDKKDKSGKKYDAKAEATLGTKEDPICFIIDTPEQGAKAMYEMKKAADAATPVTEVHFRLNQAGSDYFAQANIGEKRVTWKLGNTGIGVSILNNILCQTELDYDTYGCYGLDAPKGLEPKEEVLTEPEPEKSKKDKKGKKDKKSKVPEEQKWLITTAQLEQKYPVTSLVEALEFSQYGKKKQRKAIVDLFPKKKATGEDMIAAMNEVFGEDMPAHDIFAKFEFMEKA